MSLDVEQEVYMYLMVNQKVRFSDVCDFVHERLPEKLRKSFKHYGPAYQVLKKMEEEGLIKKYMVDGKLFIEIA